MTDTTSNTQPAPNEDQPTPTVPYSRFSQVLTRAKAAEAELATLKAGNSEVRSVPATRDDTAPSPSGVAPTAPADTTNWKAKYDATAAELRSLNQARLRDRAAVKVGLPLDMADRLVGDTEAAILKDAELLASRIGRRSAAPNIDATARTEARPAFTMAQISDPTFYQANQAAIMQAYREGRIR